MIRWLAYFALGCAIGVGCVLAVFTAWYLLIVWGLL